MNRRHNPDLMTRPQRWEQGTSQRLKIAKPYSCDIGFSVKQGGYAEYWRTWYDAGEDSEECEWVSSTCCIVGARLRLWDGCSNCYSPTVSASQPSEWIKVKKFIHLKYGMKICSDLLQLNWLSMTVPNTMKSHRWKRETAKSHMSSISIYYIIY